MNSSTDATAAAADSKSALQDNLDRKGKNAYYFAHAHKATGPKWDGKPEPKLLERTLTTDSSSSCNNNNNTTSFDYSKSTITTYAFLDDGPKVKLYIDLVGSTTSTIDDDDDNAVALEFGERSLSLVVKTSPPQTLCFARLTGAIHNATVRRKPPNRIIVTLTKVDKETVWHTINDKGNPDHEVV